MMQKQEKTPSMTGIQGAFEEGKNECSSETRLWRQMTLLVVPFSEVKLERLPSVQKLIDFGMQFFP